MYFIAVKKLGKHSDHILVVQLVFIFKIKTVHLQIPMFAFVLNIQRETKSAKLPLGELAFNISLQ